MIVFQTLDTDTTEENYSSDEIEQINNNANEKAIGKTIVSAEQLFILECSYETKYRNEEATDKTDDNDTKTKAYEHSESVLTATSEYKKAIKCYQKASESSSGFEDEEEVTAFQWLGYNHVQAGQHQESKMSQNEPVKSASKQVETKEVSNSAGIYRLFWEK